MLCNKHMLSISQYDAVIDPPSNARFAHHMLLYKCGIDMAAYAGQSGACFEQPGAHKGK